MSDAGCLNFRQLAGRVMHCRCSLSCIAVATVPLSVNHGLACHGMAATDMQTVSGRRLYMVFFWRLGTRH
tara:strand:+ start:647 stop:856 length:210 start_codon:yes stop_codon:yes gene_type:complete